MFWWLRNTVRRGLAAVPMTFLRIWRFRLSLLTIFFCSCLIGYSALLARAEGLARLLDDLLILVPDPLALVGLRRADLPDARREFAHFLLVHALHHHVSGLGDLHGDPLGDRHVHRMGKPHLQDEALPLDFRIVAHPDDAQGALETLGDSM